MDWHTRVLGQQCRAWAQILLQICAVGALATSRSFGLHGESHYTIRLRPVQYHGRTQTYATYFVAQPLNQSAGSTECVRGWNEMSARSRHLIQNSCPEHSFFTCFGCRCMLFLTSNREHIAHRLNCRLHRYNWGLLNVDALQKSLTHTCVHRTRIRRRKRCCKKVKVIYHWMSIHWRKVSFSVLRTISVTLSTRYRCCWQWAKCCTLWSATI